MPGGSVVFVQEQSQAVVVHLLGFRERKRLPHKPCQTLAQDVVEPLAMTGLARAFAGRSMLLLGQHLGISRPEVGVQEASLVILRDTLPQQAARCFASAADDISDDLACPAALGQPDPTLVFAAQDSGARQRRKTAAQDSGARQRRKTAAQDSGARQRRKTNDQSSSSSRTSSLRAVVKVADKGGKSLAFF